jgi:hypothetical protein
MTPFMAGPLVFLAVVVASDVWVVWDATRLRERGREVVASEGPISLDSPEDWFVACVVVWMVASRCTWSPDDGCRNAPGLGHPAAVI